MKTMLKSFWNDEAGLTAVEYAIAGALVSAAVVLAFTNLGAAITARIEAITTAIGG